MSKLAWPAAIPIFDRRGCGRSRRHVRQPAERASASQQNSQAQPASNSGQSQATAQPPTQTQTQARARGQPQNQVLNLSMPRSARPPSAQPAPSQSWSAEPQQTHIQEQPVSDPFSGRPSTSVAESSDGRGEVRSVKSIRPNAVKVDDNGVVDLRVNGEEVTAVLEMLSLQSQKTSSRTRTSTAKCSPTCMA